MSLRIRISLHQSCYQDCYEVSGLWSFDRKKTRPRNDLLCVWWDVKLLYGLLNPPQLYDCIKAKAKTFSQGQGHENISRPRM